MGAVERTDAGGRNLPFDSPEEVVCHFLSSWPLEGRDAQAGGIETTEDVL
jgi:hypothetical protein